MRRGDQTEARATWDARGRNRGKVTGGTSGRSELCQESLQCRPSSVPLPTWYRRWEGTNSAKETYALLFDGGRAGVAKAESPSCVCCFSVASEIVLMPKRPIGDGMF